MMILPMKCTWFSQLCVQTTGRVFNKEWCVVVRCDVVGDPDICSRASVRRTDWRPGRRKLRLLLPRGRSQRRTSWPRPRESCARSASQLSAWDLWPDGRMLEPRGVTEANVPRGAHVPAEEEHGIQRSRRTTDTITHRCPVCLARHLSRCLKCEYFIEFEVFVGFVGIKPGMACSNLIQKEFGIALSSQACIRSAVFLPWCSLAFCVQNIPATMKNIIIQTDVH